MGVISATEQDRNTELVRGVYAALFDGDFAAFKDATRDDFEAHEARVCIHSGRSLSDPKRPREFTPEQYLALERSCLLGNGIVEYKRLERAMDKNR